MQIPPAGPPSERPTAQKVPSSRPADRPSQSGAHGQPAAVVQAHTISDQVADALSVAAQFIVDESTKRILVRIYNSRTGQTIRTIPPTEVVNMLLETISAESAARLDRLV